MQRAVSLVSVMVLGTLQVAPVLLDSLILTQENFDLDQFMGKWSEVAVASTCPHYMQRKRGNPVMVALELEHVTSGDNFTMTATTVRNGSCAATSTDYSLTETPGRFLHHVARFAADVETFVVNTNYDEHAVMLLLSTERPSGNRTTTVKLYSRTVGASPAVLDLFTALVTQHGMRDDAIVLNQHKGTDRFLQDEESVLQANRRQSPLLSLRFCFPRGHLQKKSTLVSDQVTYGSP